MVRVKKILKIAENSQVLTESNSRISRISTGYQPDIKGPDIMSCHPLDFTLLVAFVAKHNGARHVAHNLT